MSFQECIKFANENPTCSFATVENNQPRVRLLGLWFADTNGFYFQTNANGNIINQLKLNRKVEMCFYKAGGMMGTMLRISGKVEFLSNNTLKEKVLSDRPFLKRYGMTAESPNLIIFRIPHGEFHLWTMESGKNIKENFKF